MNTLETTGGARIGTANATWPFAVLKVDKNKLELNASIVGNLVFRPQDIISITPYSSFINNGLRINHRVTEYKSEVIFWTFGDPTLLINQIKQIGFFESQSKKISFDDQEIIERQRSGSFPIKKSIAILFGVIWNVLFFYDIISFFASGRKGMPLGNGAVIALGTVLLSSILLLISNDFSKLILKEGRTIKDVNRFIYMLIFISIFMLTTILFLRTKV